MRQWRTDMGGALVICLGMVVGMVAASAAPVRFGNVTVDCADDGTCVAAIAARDADGAVTSVLQLQRTAVPRSRWTVAITTLGALPDTDRPVSFAVNGGVATRLRAPSDIAPFVNANTFYVLSQQALDRMMSDLQVGYEARVSFVDAGGVPHTERFRLEGMTPALADIDRRQGRIVGDRRAGPPQDLPPPPEVDETSLVELEGIPPRLVAWHAASSECEALDTPSLSAVEPVVAPLSDTAMLYALPCFVSESAPAFRLYMIESGEIGGMHTLYFAVASARYGWVGTDVLGALDYDPQTRRLSAVHAGASDGCAAAGTWSWDAVAFRLEEMRASSRCGSDPGDPAGWPVVWSR